jgi:hypothetical protein
LRQAVLAVRTLVAADAAYESARRLRRLLRLKRW